MFGTFDQFFAPGRRHAEEERRRQELTVEDIGDTDPGKGPIDLTGGVVLIRLPPDRPDRPDRPDSAAHG